MSEELLALQELTLVDISTSETVLGVIGIDSIQGRKLGVKTEARCELGVVVVLMALVYTQTLWRSVLVSDC